MILKIHFSQGVLKKTANGLAIDQRDATEMMSVVTAHLPVESIQWKSKDCRPRHLKTA
jgi:hypothetical protein